MRWMVLIFLILLHGPALQADPAPIHLTDHRVTPLKDEIFYMEDDTGAKDLKDIIASPSPFKALPMAFPLFGSTKSALWLNMNLVNDTQGDADQYLEISNPLLNSIELFVVDNNGQTRYQYKTGNSLTFKERPVNYSNFVFPVKIPKNESVKIFLRVLTTGPLQVPITLHEHDEFDVTRQSFQIYQGLWFGALLIMMCYHLFVFYSTRGLSYLFYSCFVGGYLVFMAQVRGFSFQFCFPDNPAALPNLLVSIMGFTSCASTLFSYSFLNLHQGSNKIKYLLMSYFFPALLLTLLGPLLPINLGLTLLSLLSVAVLITLISIGLYRMNRGEKEALFFTTAWAVYLVCSIVYELAGLRILPDNWLTTNSQQLGALFELLLLSFALADRLNTLQTKNQKNAEDKRLAQEQLLAGQQENILTLDRKIEQQTADLLSQKEQLAKMSSNLQEADKQKSHFFRNISHELRTPLTLIMGTQDKLAKQYPNNPIVEVGSKNTKRLYRLVNQLLDFQRLDSTNKAITLSPINLTSFIKVCSNYFCTAISTKALKVVTTIEGFSMSDERSNVRILIKGELDALEKITFNFLSNAMKYSPTGATINFGIITRADRIRIFVQDAGPGISPENREKLFKIFSRVDGVSNPEYEGTGLGLALAKELTIKMNGEIGVDSDVENGSCFWAEFPLYTGWKESLDLLIVDDEVDFTDMIRRQFVNYPCSIKTANSPKQARALISKYQIKVLLTDQIMPDEDGVSLLAFMGREQPSCARLMFTGHADQNVLQRAINEGSVQRVYYKPLEIQEIIVPDILEFIRTIPVQEIIDVKENLEVKDWLWEKADTPIGPELLNVEPDGPSDESKELVLIIDSLRDMRDLIAGTIKRHFRTMVCASGEDGLTMAKTYKPDLIIVDWMMPKMSGPEFINIIRNINEIAETPIILLTAKTDGESKLAGLQIGADAFLGKPFDELELISTVTNLLRLKSGEQMVASSLEDKSILVAMITHDIANPLTVTASATELLEEMLVSKTPGAESERALKYIEQIKKSSTSISSIISQVRLLESADNKQSFDFQAVDIGEAFEESLFIIKDKIAAKQLLLEKHVDNAVAHCDRSALVHSVINNLLTNAIKFSATGGKIICKARQAADNRVVIEISDEGCGIPPEMQSVLFSIHHRTSRPGTSGEKGTGFGLPIVKKLITRMGGTISVASPYQRENGEICSGAKFSISLPAQQMSSHDTTKDNKTPHALHHPKKAVA